MKYVCECTKGRTWFRIETDAEAEAETTLMRHAVEKHFRREQARARKSYVPGQGLERDIQLKAHLQRTTPLFLTLRADDGTGLVTAMLPPGGKPVAEFPTIIVGPENADPYPDHGDAIEALARHYQLPLPRARCYPYAQRS